MTGADWKSIQGGKKDHLFSGEKAEKEIVDGGDTGIIKPDNSVYDSLRFIKDVDPKRMFAFSISESDLTSLGELAEEYLLFRLGSGIQTLDFYKRMRDYDNKF